MNMLEAAKETVGLAETRGMDDKESLIPELSFEHLVSMMERMKSTAISPAKMGRWLGWMQCAVVAAGCGTLEEMKAINMRHSQDTDK